MILSEGCELQITKRTRDVTSFSESSRAFKKLFNLTKYVLLIFTNYTRRLKQIIPSCESSFVVSNECFGKFNGITTRAPHLCRTNKKPWCVMQFPVLELLHGVVKNRRSLLKILSRYSTAQSEVTSNASCL